MIKTIEKRICDVCKQEVANFAGSLHLKYFEPFDETRNYPVALERKIERKEICLDCCRELNKALQLVLGEESE